MRTDTTPEVCANTKFMQGEKRPQAYKLRKLCDARQLALEKRWVKSLEEDFIVGQLLLPQDTRRLSMRVGAVTDDQKPVVLKIGIPWTPQG